MANKSVVNTTKNKIEIHDDGMVIEIEGKDETSMIPEEIELPEGLEWAEDLEKDSDLPF